MSLLIITWLWTRSVLPQTVVEFRQQDNDLTLATLVIMLGCFTLLEGVYPDGGFRKAYVSTGWSMRFYTILPIIWSVQYSYNFLTELKGYHTTQGMINIFCVNFNLRTATRATLYLISVGNWTQFRYFQVAFQPTTDRVDIRFIVAEFRHVGVDQRDCHLREVHGAELAGRGIFSSLDERHIFNLHQCLHNEGLG